MRVIVDTSAFIRACLGSATCRRVIDLCLAEDHSLVLSEPLLAEYDCAPRQPQLIDRLDLDAYLATRNAIVPPAEFHEPVSVGRVCRDAEDDHLLGLIRAAGADLLVTLDQDLLALGQFDIAKIVAPATACRILGG